jgi:superfamily II DNA or RNA helicase
VPPIIPSKLERFVSASVRKRGAEYERDGAVAIHTNRKSGDPLQADVQGSRLYNVALRYENGELLALCTCPYFDENLEICKHIWAAVLVCGAQKVEFPGAPSTLFPDDDDTMETEDDLVGDEDLDDEGWVESAPRRPVFRWSSPSRKPWVPLSPWKYQLQTLTNNSDARATVAPPPEITWILDAPSSTSMISIEIAARSLKKNGELGKPQPLRISADAISQVSSPADREILAILTGSRYGYGASEPRVSIGWPMAEYLLPKLIETGRLWIRTVNREYFTNVTLDAGDPWHLAVRAEDRNGKWALIGTLERGEERVPLRDALAVTQGGFVIFRNTIARFAGDGNEGWASLLRREQIEIPAAELDEFIRDMTRAQTSIAIDFPAALQWQQRHVVPRATLDIRNRGYDNDVSGVPRFEYDGNAVAALQPSRPLYDEKTKTIYVRGPAEESRKLEALWAQRFYRNGESVAIDAARLGDAIPKLIEAGWEVRGAEGIYAAGGDLQLELRSAIDWFDLDGTVVFGEERVRLPRLLTALRKGESVVALSDGRMGMIPSEWRAQLEPFMASAAEESEGALRYRRNQVMLLDAMLAARKDVAFDEVFDRARRKILEVKIQPAQPPATFRGVLRPYQSEGLGWFSFLRDLGFGGCLADDMGLGKTIQVLALLDERRRANGDERRPSLVVVPRSLVFNWKAESARFTPELRLLDHATPDRIRASDHFADFDVVLTTYALLRREAEIFAGVEFDYVILDEAQAIKNAQSQAAKAATLLRARHRLALSGTPVENHLGELASLFEFLNPGMLRAGSSRVMKMLRHAGSKAPEAAEARVMLARAVRPFILRRTKAQVARELPDRVEQTITCELEPKQRKLYDELRDYYRASLLGRVKEKGINRSQIHILEALLRMRQAACHPGLVDPKRSAEPSAKLDALFEELPILIEGGHKVLVFSQFTSFLAIVRKEMQQRGIAHAYLDGKSRDRQEQVRRFQEDPTIPAFLISLKAGGLGLNLTAAEYVFLLDPWWNPAVEAQAIDRAHRIGQSRNVFAYRLVARDTIEEKILQLQQTKRDLADAIISEENSILRQLTAEDLDLLLS